MSIKEYWPNTKNITDCIKPEAETPKDAVFLAVHQPMKLTNRHFDSNVSTKGTEREFLDAFLCDELPTGTLIVPILGSSGIGKSHLVRWLDVQLRRRPDSEKRHVIRIPKSSSLKTVLRKILDGLEGKGFSKLRKQLESAREKMDHIQATERIRAELLIAITRRTNEAEASKAKAIEGGVGVHPKDEQWIGHGGENYLPAILKDTITSKLFMEEFCNRPGIIIELARHLVEDSSVENMPRSQFEETDFKIPDELQDTIAAQAGVPAKKYLRRLGRGDGKAVGEAIELLNEIIDDAIAPLATPGDTSLSELFYEVRRELLKEGRELVLLVEDFAVLAGIQGALLDAMIREGVRGKQEACVMRTALAVTEGYFTSFDTVRTRAVSAWHIDDVPDDNEEYTINRICDFAGAYLNAARFGADKLDSLCKMDTSGAFSIPDFDDEVNLSADEANQIEAFGKSPSGREMFPFNREAVREIVDWKMRDATDNLQFNPRTIINELLVPVLRENCEHYLKGRFPTKSFLSFDPKTVDPNVREQIVQQNHGDEIQGRQLPLVRFWGGNPSDLVTMKVPKGVYQAFGLPVPNEAPVAPVRDSDRRQTAKSSATSSDKSTLKGPVPTKVDEKEPRQISEWDERLNSWSENNQMLQKDANHLRSLIVDHVLATFNWEAELLSALGSKEITDLTEWVYLPFSRGAAQCNRKNAFIAVASDEEFVDSNTNAQIILGLQALIRFNHHKTWDFEKSELQFSRYSNLIERCRNQANSWFKRKYNRIEGDPIPALVGSLLIGSRILNIDQAFSDDDETLIDAVFATCDIPDGGESEWGKLRLRCYNYRQIQINELARRVVARQGDGRKEFAVDSCRLLSAISEFKADWKIKSAFPKQRTNDIETTYIDNHVKELDRKLDSAIKTQKNEVLSQWKTIQDQLGDDFDKEILVTDVGDVIVSVFKSQSAIADSTLNLNQVEKLVAQFREAPVSMCLSHLPLIQEQTTRKHLLASLARIDDETLSIVNQFVSTIGAFLEEAEIRIKGEVDTYGKNIIDNAAKVLESKLIAFENIIESCYSGSAE